MIRSISFPVLAAACALGLMSASPAGAQSAKEASASKAFYNIKGGQTVLVANDSKLAAMPQAIKPSSRKWDRNLDTWGLQSEAPPAGLVRLKDGPFINDNVKVTGGQAIGYTESLLVDPATGLVHYLVATGGAIGHGNYLPVPVSALDMRTLETLVSSREAKIMTAYSDSDLDRKFPAQQMTMPVRAAEVVLVPTDAVQK